MYEQKWFHFHPIMEARQTVGRMCSDDVVLALLPVLDVLALTMPFLLFFWDQIIQAMRSEMKVNDLIHANHRDQLPTFRTTMVTCFSSWAYDWYVYELKNRVLQMGGILDNGSVSFRFRTLHKFV